MRAGQLRDTITFLQPVKNDWGEPGNPEIIGDCRAEVIDKAGDNTSTAGAYTKKRTISIKIRYRKNLQGTELIRWLGDLYKIAHIERDPRRRYMLLTCEREQ